MNVSGAASACISLLGSSQWRHCIEAVKTGNRLLFRQNCKRCRHQSVTNAFHLA
jgi:hypothetical protein